MSEKDLSIGKLLKELESSFDENNNDLEGGKVYFNRNWKRKECGSLATNLYDIILNV